MSAYNPVAYITYSDVGGFPAGTVVDHIVVALMDSTGKVTESQQVPAATSTVTFAGTYASGTYTIAAQGFGAASVPLASAAVSAPFTITTAPVTITLSLPNAVSVA